jgi:phospholipid/cholesterol/gamma-HCH transport system permease protein
LTATPVHALGARSLNTVGEFGRITRFGGRLLLAIVKPPFRFRRLVEEIYNTGVLSLAIVCSSGAAVGLVLGLQLYWVLNRFGAEEALGTAVGLSLVRELGPVLTALLVTGRAGSSIAAEIGAMVATEQLDGLRMMSVDPIHFVAAPKALAMTFVMPILSTLFVLASLAGAYAVGVGQLGVDGGAYITALEQSIEFEVDVVGMLIKAVIFGMTVGLISTYRGYSSEPNAAGVSSATTNAVVQASVATIIFDFFITALWGF